MKRAFIFFFFIIKDIQWHFFKDLGHKEFASGNFNRSLIWYNKCLHIIQSNSYRSKRYSFWQEKEGETLLWIGTTLAQTSRSESRKTLELSIETLRSINQSNGVEIALLLTRCYRAFAYTIDDNIQKRIKLLQTGLDILHRSIPAKSFWHKIVLFGDISLRSKITRELGKLNYDLSENYEDIGKLYLAGSKLRHSLKLLKLSVYPNKETDLSNIYQSLAHWNLNNGDALAAIKELNERLRINLKLVKQYRYDTMKRSFQVHLALASSYFQLGRFYFYYCETDLDEVINMFQRSLALRLKCLPWAGSGWHRIDIVVVLRLLGTVYLKQSNLTMAEQMFEECSALLQNINLDLSISSAIANESSQLNLQKGYCKVKQGIVSQAHIDFNNSLKLNSVLLKDIKLSIFLNSINIVSKQRLVSCYSFRAKIFCALGEIKNAIDQVELSRRIQQELPWNAIDFHWAGCTCTILGDLYIKNNNVVKAIECYKEAAAILEQTLYKCKNPVQTLAKDCYLAFGTLINYIEKDDPILAQNYSSKRLLIKEKFTYV